MVESPQNTPPTERKENFMEGDALVLFHYQMIFSFLWKSVLVLGILLWAFSDPEDDDGEDIHHGPL